MVDEDRIANQRFARCRSQLGSRKKKCAAEYGSRQGGAAGIEEFFSHLPDVFVSGEIRRYYDGPKNSDEGNACHTKSQLIPESLWHYFSLGWPTFGDGAVKRLHWMVDQANVWLSGFCGRSSVFCTTAELDAGMASTRQ